MEKDWRLVHLETQPWLRGVSFKRKSYTQPRPEWDHDHCVGCWLKLAEERIANDDVIHEGYATTADFIRGADYNWVCAECFEEFRSAMDWRDVTPSLSA